MDRSFWRVIANDENALPQGEWVAELTPELLGWLGSTDPELRDEFAYRILAAWIERGQYAPDQLRTMAKQMTANVELGLGEDPSDSVFLRTYSVLILMEIVALDNASPFLDQTDLDGFLETALSYLRRERGRAHRRPADDAGPQPAPWRGRAAADPGRDRRAAARPHAGGVRPPRGRAAGLRRPQRAAARPGRPLAAGGLAGPVHGRARPGVLAVGVRQRGRLGLARQRHRLPAGPLLPDGAHREPTPGRPGDAGVHCRCPSARRHRLFRPRLRVPIHRGTLLGFPGPLPIHRGTLLGFPGPLPIHR